MVDGGGVGGQLVARLLLLLLLHCGSMVGVVVGGVVLCMACVAVSFSVLAVVVAVADNEYGVAVAVRLEE